MGDKTQQMLAHRSGENNNHTNVSPRLEPWRISDGVIKFGKYKGTKIQQVPLSYLKWMLRKMDMTETRRSILKNMIDESK